MSILQGDPVAIQPGKKHHGLQSGGRPGPSEIITWLFRQNPNLVTSTWPYNRPPLRLRRPYLATHFFALSTTMAQIIVVGGGLAGLSAAHTLLERGANVLLLDKQGSVVLKHISHAPQFIML